MFSTWFASKAGAPAKPAPAPTGSLAAAPPPAAPKPRPVDPSPPTATATPPQAVVLAVLRRLGWATHARVYRLVDLEVEADGTPRTDESWEVIGEMTPEESVATGAAPPDAATEAVFDAASHVRELENLGVNLTLRSGADPIVHDLGDRSHRPVPLLPRGDRRLRLMCWTSWDPESKSALDSVQAWATRPRPDRDETVAVLCLDDNPAKAHDLLDKRFPSQGRAGRPFAAYWVGPKGWDSEAARFLALEDAGPTAFRFGPEGRVVYSGFVEDVFPSFEDDDEEEDVPQLAEFPMDERLDSLSSEAASRFLVEEVRPRLKRVGDANPHAAGLPFSALLRARETLEEGAPPAVHRQIFVAGDLLPDAEDEFARFGEWLDSRCRGVGWLGVRHVTPPRRMVPSLACVGCGASTAPAKPGLARYVCFVCRPHAPAAATGASAREDATLCPKCAASHPANHPLAVLSVNNARERDELLWGREHVHLRAGSSDPPDDAHPGILCDGCGGGLGSGKRYKNLCAVDHDLCEQCFKMLGDFSGAAGHPTYASHFKCKPSHVFAELKSSLGVAFDREASVRRESRDSRALSVVSVAAWPPPDFVAAAFGGGFLGPIDAAHFPVGHTRFSWTPHPNTPMGVGHTLFSWTAAGVVGV